MPGIPAPQGSKRAFRNKYSGRIQQVESSARIAPWRSDVRDAAMAALAIGEPLFSGPLTVRLRFVFARPKSHLSASGAMKASAPTHLATGPDLDKLCRAVLDACTGLLWTDDRQVDDLVARKQYGDRPGLEASVLER